MNQKLFQKYLREVTIQALEVAGDDVSAAANILAEKAKPFFWVKDRAEKKAALERARKVFSESRGRPLYVVLKSLGLDDLAKEKL